MIDRITSLDCTRGLRWLSSTWSRHNKLQKSSARVKTLRSLKGISLEIKIILTLIMKKSNRNLIKLSELLTMRLSMRSFITIIVVRGFIITTMGNVINGIIIISHITC